MARLIWSQPALFDLEEIAEYIALDNPSAAARYVRKVFSAVERLKRYPNSGGRPEELPATPYREVIVPPCRVFYRAEEDAVFILHVMRSERLLRSFLLEQRDDDL
ncbi:MAG: type II toxin-antitoxin system RelE/ParE family toxin [Spirochaetaceae bacterium]|nr:MAG: type II toxin-antitoxin system RelE/ParE family toxin [Spirochaetaceae bacterium]